MNSFRTLITLTFHRKTLQCVWIVLLAYFYVPTVLLSVVGNNHRNAQLLSELDMTSCFAASTDWYRLAHEPLCIRQNKTRLFTPGWFMHLDSWHLKLLSEFQRVWMGLLHCVHTCKDAALLLAVEPQYIDELPLKLSFYHHLVV